MNRREFLKHAGATAAAVALAGPGCTSHPSQKSSPAETPSPSQRPTGPPTDADWTALASRLSGEAVRPGDPSYAAAARLFNPRFDSILPAAVVYCGSASDVQRTVAFARTHQLPIAARSGGHSYAGYSTGTGIVCDVSRISGVAVQGDGSAVIGAGARLVDVYDALAPHGLTIPAGSCPTVGVAGLALGGGIGVVGRAFGLTCDSISELKVITAAGDAVTCNAYTNPDLDWACRGGGGGNFGIVTSLSFRTHPVSTLTLFSIGWRWAAAADVIAAWQQWIAALPDELWSNCEVLSSATPGPPTISVGGAYLGDQAQLAPWLSALRRLVGAAATHSSVGTHAYFEAMMVEAGCGGQSAAACHLPAQNPQGTLQREASLGRSDIVLQPWSRAAIDTVVAAVAQRQGNPSATTVAGVALDALGGAINRVPAAATAFVHRSALFSAQYNATWPTGAAADTVQSNVEGVNALYVAMRPYASGFAYQNYIDPQLVDWQTAYYGSNLARLRSVKAEYDPDDLFHFAQSIPAR